MSAIKYATRRSLVRIGNGEGATMPKSWLEDQGLLDDSGEIVDVEFEVYETDDGGIKFRPVN